MDAPRPAEDRAERLTRLYREYGPVIYSRCRRLLGDEAGAADATQETFMRVMKHLDSAPDEALRWIYRIATNHCLSELRSRRTRLAAVPEIPVPDGATAEDALADRDLAEQVVRAVPEKLRVVAWLRHVDGLRQAEIATILGVTERTVINRLDEFGERARKLVRRTS
jgi:RNA polymerase sigma-70 factor (ECF subfamily)